MRVELRGERVVLRPLTEADVDRIVEFGADPEVARWWPGLTVEEVGGKARGEDEDVTVFAIVVDGEVAGMIQHHEETDPEYRSAGMEPPRSGGRQGFLRGADPRERIRALRG